MRLSVVAPNFSCVSYISVVQHMDSLPFSLFFIDSSLLSVLLMLGHVQGSRISYGGLFIASKPSIIATIPLGYADGFRRMLGHTKEGGPSWHVLIGGNKSPIAGRVCMDMFMVDVTGTAPDCKAGDEVRLVGVYIILNRDSLVVSPGCVDWQAT